MKVHARTYGYGLVVVLMALVVGWVGRNTWRDLRQLDQSFGAVQSDAFHLSEYVEASIRDLNEIVMRFDLRGLAEDRIVFQQKCLALRDWMRSHQAMAITLNERDLMAQIQSAFDLYGSLTAQLMEARAREGAAPSPTPILEQVEGKAAPILKLTGFLKEAEQTAQTQFMSVSHDALVRLQEQLTVQLGLLVILVGTAIVAVYRGVIGPLRVELGESRARAARHEKLAALGTMAAGVAHEIRNPLTAINVRLHSLKKTLAHKSSEEEDALVIGHEIQRLERIVQEFLLFARPADPKFLIVSVDSLIARIQSLFGPRLEKNSIQLRVESVPDIWVQVDPHQIEQVLINLIQNAAESMEKGGTITLRASGGTGRLSGRNRPVVIVEVSDTGKGIPPEVRKRMFDPFFTTKEEGTGLGLAIAARIVEKHGGALECRSEMNRGTTFALLLPHAKPEENHELSN